MDAIATFVVDLARYQRVPLTFNPWFDYDEEYDVVGGAILRQQALADFLRDRPKPAIALIGLAPGYAGARFSGVPFVDENHVTQWHGVRYSQRQQPWAEASATVVLDTLATLGITDTTVMWNAFPFHPYQEGKPLSNRTPTAEEVRTHGKLWLARFLDVTSPGIVVPVGRVAERAVRDLGIENSAPYVRHPAYGGDTEFARGLLTITRGLE